MSPRPSFLRLGTTITTTTTFLLLLSDLIFLSSFSSSDNSQYQTCSPTFKCGPLEDLSYPFWSDARPQYCGHPAFKLACSNASATIKLPSQTLDVLSINMTMQHMAVSLPDFSNDPCPDTLLNTTLDTATLNYTSGVKTVTFFYNCSSTQTYEGGTKFMCPSGSYFSEKTAYYVTNPTPNGLNGSMAKVCELNIVVPMLGTALEGMASGSWSVSEGLKKGFEVEWVGLEGGDRCKSCVASGGVCGYNSTLNEATCFCSVPSGCNVFGSGSGGATSNGSDYGSTDLASPPPSPGKENNTKKIGIGVGVGILGSVIVVSALFFLYVRRYKKQHSPKNSTMQFRNLPSNQSTLSNLESGDTYLGVNLFNYDELEEATNYFNPSKELGDGGFGTVYYGKLRDGREVAIKRLYENNSKRVQQFMNEIEILARLRHKNLVTLYGCTSRHSRELLLVYEYVSNGTVADHLHGRRRRLDPSTEFSPLPWRTRLSIAAETASALVYLHASDIIHRDVKTNNILLDKNLSVKVADFGLSRLFPFDVTHVSTAPQGTPGYVDPEYHQCYQLTDKSDVYSFGVVLAELISAMAAVDITRQRHEINLSSMVVNRIQNDALHDLVDPRLGFESDEKVKEEVTAVAELAFQCLQHEREARPAMEEVLEVLTRIQRGEDREMEGKNKQEKLKQIDAAILMGVIVKGDQVVSDFSTVSSPGTKEKSDSSSTTTFQSSR